MAHVSVKLLGMFRLDTGLHELEADAESVKDLYPILLAKAREAKPGTQIKAADIDGCIILIDGKQCRKYTKLEDGQTVYLMSPVCGG